MAKTDFKSVDEYIASRPSDTQEILERVRSIIRKAVPAADEVISYQIPTYKLYGHAVLYFAGWKEHYSLYPANARLVAAFKMSWRRTRSTTKEPYAFRSPNRFPRN